MYFAKKGPKATGEARAMPLRASTNDATFRSGKRRTHIWGTPFLAEMPTPPRQTSLFMHHA